MQLRERGSLPNGGAPMPIRKSQTLATNQLQPNCKTVPAEKQDLEYNLEGQPNLWMHLTWCPTVSEKEGLSGRV